MNKNNIIRNNNNIITQRPRTTTHHQQTLPLASFFCHCCYQKNKSSQTITVKIDAKENKNNIINMNNNKNIKIINMKKNHSGSISPVPLVSLSRNEKVINESIYNSFYHNHNVI
jgi:hypothetical protein